MKQLLLVLTLLTSLPLLASDADLFVEHKIFPSGASIVVAETAGEPRSIGTYTVQLHSETYLSHDCIMKLTRPRDGTILKIVETDLTGDKIPELIVVIQSVGTGSYLSADAFSVTPKKIRFISSLKNLPKNTDAVALLCTQLGR